MKQNNEELYHYGVLGMKWGIKKAKYDDVVERSNKKLSRIDSKYEKYQEKANKYYTKADSKLSGIFKNESKAAKYEKKAKLYQRKAVKYATKGSEWLKNMSAAFKDTPLKITEENAALGKKYTDILLKRNMMRY